MVILEASEIDLIAQDFRKATSTMGLENCFSGNRRLSETTNDSRVDPARSAHVGCSRLYCILFTSRAPLVRCTESYAGNETQEVAE